MKLDRELCGRWARELENNSYFVKRYQRTATCGQRRSLIRSTLTDRTGSYYTTDIEDGEQLRRYFDDLWNITSDPEGQHKYDHLPTIWDEQPKKAAPPPKPALNPRLKPLVDKIMKLGIGKKWESSDKPEYVSSLASHFGYYLHHGETELLIEAIDAARKQQLTTAPAKEEPIMNNPIEVITKTFVNGNDVSKMPDSEIYALIAAEELRIRELTSIQNKPKRLMAEIAKREAGIQALVAYLDSKE